MSHSLDRRRFLKSIPAGLAAGSLIASSQSSEGMGLVFPSRRKAVIDKLRIYVEWDAEKQIETMVLQPIIRSTVNEFGLIIPFPTKPIVAAEKPEFFALLSAFCQLERMPIGMFKDVRREDPADDSQGGQWFHVDQAVLNSTSKVKVQQRQTDHEVFKWAKNSGYAPEKLMPKIQKFGNAGWHFVLMNVDANKMSGKLEKQPVPMKFAFRTRSPWIPIEMLRGLVQEWTPVELYFQAKNKLDLPGQYSYQPMWQVHWDFAFSKLQKTKAGQETWHRTIKPFIPEYKQQIAGMKSMGQSPTSMRFAKQITSADLSGLTGGFTFRGRMSDIHPKLVDLKSVIKPGNFLVCATRSFRASDFNTDLILQKAAVGQSEEMESEQAPATPTQVDPKLLDTTEHYFKIPELPADYIPEYKRPPKPPIRNRPPHIRDVLRQP